MIEVSIACPGVGAAGFAAWPSNLRIKFLMKATALSMLKYATGTINSVRHVPVIVPKRIVIPSERHIAAASSRLKTIGKRPRVFIKSVISSGLSLSQQDSNIALRRSFRSFRLVLIFSTSMMEL